MFLISNRSSRNIFYVTAGVDTEGVDTAGGDTAGVIALVGATIVGLPIDSEVSCVVGPLEPSLEVSCSVFTDEQLIKTTRQQVRATRF